MDLTNVLWFIVGLILGKYLQGWGIFNFIEEKLNMNKRNNNEKPKPPIVKESKLSIKTEKKFNPNFQDIELLDIPKEALEVVN